MAEPKSQRAICLEFECLYDRYAREKLAQVYRILVPAGNDPITPRSDCFRLEQQLPGGLSSSHWINVPFPRRTIFAG